MRSLKSLATACLLAAGGAGLPARALEAAAWPGDAPVYRHVVIVLEENKDYDQIIGSPAAPYLNRLRAEGANLTRMYGEEHNSEGNYFWLFSGSNQGVGFRDEPPAGILRTPSLGGQLLAAHPRSNPRETLSFKGYAEDLPEPGSLAVTARPYYARKHVPYASFEDLRRDGRDRQVNLPFTAFPGPGGFDRLPTVAFVIPNLVNDMHGVRDAVFAGRDDAYWIRRGDDWLRDHLDAYYQWARTHDSLLIVTFDENANGTGYAGLTDPAGPSKVLENRIATVIAGAHVRPGDYPEGKGVTHVNLLRTLEAMYGLPRLGAQQPNASAAGIDDRFIQDVFTGR